ncbi:oxygen-independent coproporphyrinogen III oxidase [Marinigracilibium pacificum]|uniref:Coproporphyrinogen-III oxidase n=1 Tax=Marinigracilibium pacificum TaxID=2729599 RepID=A0A848IYG4_9BACT|nr:oxygen-independent coproporphyrinogen III oxidase [Marinigracilibium pacificum]NMM48208.1 oxygen-independent coproporphyrinogen III oxidase [Marinigracilibium pacificum]
MLNNKLIRKYNVAGPRYTSYPTVPYWNEEKFNSEEYISRLKQQFRETNNEGNAIYMHLPFCESLCTFCGCNKRITKNHSVESPYLEALAKEWNLYLDALEAKPKINALHLGGGTPTFFSPLNLHKFLSEWLKTVELADKYEFSFEGHPNNTTREHLEALYELGFKRVSYGVQDLDHTVQVAINRIQPLENVVRAIKEAREVGYESVNVDLVYGLPFQKVEHVENTIKEISILKPDRIAFYSYAHVPWIKGNGQRKFTEEDLPAPEVKRKMYEYGKELLLKYGYIEIGMDHFALPEDELSKAMENGELFRNFMGYTVGTSKVMVGLGVSSIGDCWTGFAQNEKSLEDYYEALENNRLPIMRGHLLGSEDLTIRKIILDLMCNFKHEWAEDDFTTLNFANLLSRLKPMVDDQLVKLTEKGIMITRKGRPFVRNVCMAFDLRLHRNKPEMNLFSSTI